MKDTSVSSGVRGDSFDADADGFPADPSLGTV
jgi:hypothetical protein